MDILSPQPVGLYSGPAAHMLLPSLRAPELTTCASQLLTKLMTGDVAGDWPEEWQFFLAAIAGDIEQANQLLSAFDDRLSESGSAADSTDRQICSYNRFLINPAAESLQQLQASLTNSTLIEMLGVVAYAYGMTHQLPANFTLQSELKAWAMAMVATSQLEQQNDFVARQTLADAVTIVLETSPLLAAKLLAQSAQIAQQNQLPASLIQSELKQAISLAEGGQIPGLLAELYVLQGLLLQRSAGDNREMLLAAIRAYQLALQSGISRENDPLGFAELQNNLGLAYLSMPLTESSHHLRTGIAIQSFRKALEAIDAERHAELWARINMNLANALQYAPTSHPAENLIQAVEIYEQILTVRSKARDPVAYALVILNQANALAHLGMYKPAMEKASEAYKLFQWYNHGDHATAARELVENINHQLDSLNRGDTNQRTDEQPSSQELQHGSV